MKKLLLILSLMMTGLSGCYVEPYRDHDGVRVPGLVNLERFPAVRANNDDIAVAGDKAVLLCATHRLARNLHLTHGRVR